MALVFGAQTLVKDLNAGFFFLLENQAMEVLRLLGQELRKDRPGVVLEPMEVRGIEAMSATGCTIRTLTKTAPGLQWEIAREFRRRILIRFKQEGIDMPLPHRVVWNREHPARPL